MNLHKFLLFALLTLGWQISSAAESDFDCKGSPSPVNRMICTDPNLTALDQQLYLAFKQALVAAPESVELLEQWQDNWLSTYGLDDCKTAKCLAASYSKRIDLLKAVSPSNRNTPNRNGSYTRYRKGKPDSDSAQVSLLALAGKRFYMRGFATWQHPNPAYSSRTGDFEGLAHLTPKGSYTYQDEDCAIDAKFSGKKLVLKQKEQGCGGMNVSFDGVYLKD